MRDTDRKDILVIIAIASVLWSLYAIIGEWTDRIILRQNGKPATAMVCQILDDQWINEFGKTRHRDKCIYVYAYWVDEYLYFEYYQGRKGKYVQGDTINIIYLESDPSHSKPTKNSFSP